MSDDGPTPADETRGLAVAESERIALLPIAAMLLILVGGVIAAMADGKSVIAAASSMFFQSWLQLVAVCAFTLGAGYALAQMQATPASRARLSGWLRTDALTAGYRRSLTGALDALDRYWSASDDHKDGGQGAGARASHFGALNFSLGIASALPLLLLVTQWAITGEAVRLGSLEILSSNVDHLGRGLVIAGIMIASVALLWNFQRLSTENEVEARGAGLNSKRVRIGAISILGGLVVAGAGVFLTAIKGGAVLAGLACAFAFALMVSGAVSIGVALIIAVGANLPMASIAIGGLALQYFVGNRSKWRTTALLFYVAMLFMLLAAAARLTIERDSAQAKLLIVVGFIPIIVGLFNFISIGFTLHRLRVGLRRRGVWREALVDLLVNLCIFGLLCVCVLVGYSLLYDRSGSQFFNMDEIFSGLRDHPSSYLWLLLTFASTLLPTVLHIGLTIATWFFTAFPAVLHSLAHWVDRVSVDPGLAALVSPIFGVLAYVAVVLPLLVFHSLYLIVSAFGLDIGMAMLGFLTMLAKILGVLSPEFAI